MIIRMMFVISLLWLACTTLAQSPDPADRLPSSITPLDYAIRLAPDMDSNTVQGTVIITFNTTSDLSLPLTSVVMHSGVDVTVDEDSVLLLELSGQVIQTGAIEYDDAYTLIKVVLPEGDSLKHNQKYMISLHFNSLLYSEPTGLFTGFTSSTSRYIASNFRPTFARNVFPCFDEPHLKVPVTLQVLRPSSYSAVSTAPLESSSVTKVNGMVLDTFKTTPPIPIHSLGLFISEMSPVDSPMGVTLYAPSGTPSSVPFLSSLLANISAIVGPFPIAPLKLVVLPDQLKMHLASYGFVFMSSDIYDYNEREPAFAAHVWSTLRLQLTEDFLHQFLEFSKTPMWWTHLWLSESVGAYLAAYMQPEVFPWLTIEIRSEVLGVDLDNVAHPVVDSKIGCHWEIEKAITSQSIRNKGLGVLMMWSNTLPEGVVFKTIIDFIQLQNPVVTTEDILEILVNNIQSNKTYDVTAAVGGLPLWLNTSGYPIITYLAESDNGFQLTQKPDSSEDNSQTWPVSVSLAQNGSRDWDHYRWGLWLLNESSSFFSGSFIGNQWTIFNLESGLYHLDYYRSWDTVVDALRNDLVPSTTPDSVKATIQGDAVALSLLDNLPFSTAFEVLTSTQRYMLDWLPVAKAFDFFTSRIGKDEDLYNDYKVFAASLFPKALLADLDLRVRPANARLQYIRLIMTPWLCEFNIGNFRQVVAELFGQILQGHIDNIDPGDLENAACYGAQYNSSVLPSLISSYSQPSSPQLKNLYTIGLGCLTDAPSVERVLNLLLNSGTPFARSDAKRIMVSLASKVENAATIINFVSQQTSNIQSLFGSSCLADVIQNLGKFRINISKIQALTNDHSLEPYVVHSILRSVGRINASWAWWTANAANLEAALPHHRKKTTTTTTTTTASPTPSSSSASPSPSTSSVNPTTTSTSAPTTPATTTTTTTTTTERTTSTAEATTSTGGATTSTGSATTSTAEATTSTAEATTAPPNGTTSVTTVTLPPTQQTTFGPVITTSVPSSSPESLSSVKLVALVSSFVVMVLSTSWL